ncbi:hypothetical protein EYF80_025873 [Liparis tanakae]|uniref:Uncharacterized protein n=1 Tax=Liparis tanakae TaxID=230148 RepID=A0A4Z2HEF1_9TELE|nr:hypothetical protein EYF80_025873 [Liparis tanakae]
MSHKATDPALNPSLSPEPTLTPPPHPLLIPGSDGGVEEGDREESDRGVRLRGDRQQEEPDQAKLREETGQEVPNSFSCITTCTGVEEKPHGEVATQHAARVKLERVFAPLRWDCVGKKEEGREGIGDVEVEGGEGREKQNNMKAEKDQKNKRFRWIEEERGVKQKANGPSYRRGQQRGGCDHIGPREAQWIQSLLYTNKAAADCRRRRRPMSSDCESGWLGTLGRCDRRCCPGPCIPPPSPRSVQKVQKVPGEEEEREEERRKKETQSLKQNDHFEAGWRWATYIDFTPKAQIKRRKSAGPLLPSGEGRQRDISNESESTEKVDKERVQYKQCGHVCKREREGGRETASVGLGVVRRARLISQLYRD